MLASARSQPLRDGRVAKYNQACLRIPSSERHSRAPENEMEPSWCPDFPGASERINCFLSGFPIIRVVKLRRVYAASSRIAHLKVVIKMYEKVK